MARKVGCKSVIFMCFLCSVTSFNLEPRIPVIKLGETGSYFGFSVAEHITIDEKGEKKSWLLVGAPLGQNLQPNTTRSGALWKCPLTSTADDCQQIITDGKRTIDSDHLSQPQANEIKDGQWLGVSVRSQGPGKKVVVCAHRYIRKSNELQFGQGLCYTLNNDLTLRDLLEPCRGKSVDLEHEEYSLCQVGTSSSLLDDDTLLIGSPGPYAWRGTIFVIDTDDDYFELDRTVYMAPVQDHFSPVEKYSYLGMSVIGAQFFGPEPSYAAGAPRSHGTGQVLIFHKRIKDWNNPDVDDILNYTHILNGEQFGSGFGYEIATADVNGDGLPDLLVGAPFYFTSAFGGAVYLYLNKQKSINVDNYDSKLTGKIESQFGISIANAGDLNKDGCDDVAIGSPYEGNGVVYIFMGNREKGLINKPDQVISAESLPSLMKTFGYSLSGGIDVDSNGYPDLLIGAYENSSVALIRTRPIIDIETSILPSNSITNIDPSKWGCERDQKANNTCFQFRTCCIIKSLVKSTQRSTHKLNYVIEAETFLGGKKFSRVFFDSGKTNIINKTISLKRDETNCQDHIAYVKNNTRDIQTPIKFQVSYMLVHEQPLYSTSGPLPKIDDYPVLNATAISTFTANFVNDCGPDGICISDLVVKPIMLLPSSGNGTYALTLGQEEEIKLAIYVDNLGKSAYEAQLFVEYHSNLQYIAAEINNRHLMCIGVVNKTMVSCMLENPFKKQSNDTGPITLRFNTGDLEDEHSVVFRVWANSTSQDRYPDKKPVEVEALVIKNAELLINGVARPEQVFYGGEIKGESAMKYFDDIGFRVIHTYQVINEGPWKVLLPEVLISWPYQVASDGDQGKWLLYPEDIPTVEGEAGQKNGECFVSKINPLKLTSRPGVSEPILENLVMDPLLSSGKFSVSSTHKKHNETYRKSLEYSSATENKIRRKRQSDETMKAEAYTDAIGQRKQVVNMNCEKHTAKCIKINCVIYRLGRMQGTTITVKARLWNSTLVEDYPRVSHVNIASTAKLTIPDHYNQNKKHDDSFTVETVAYPDLKISEPTGVPLWVIIISVIVGLAVLILLIIALWKLGFFKRSRPDPTLSGNLEKNHHESSPFIVRDRNSLR